MYQAKMDLLQFHETATMHLQCNHSILRARYSGVVAVDGPLLLSTRSYPVVNQLHLLIERSQCVIPPLHNDRVNPICMNGGRKPEDHTYGFYA